ncbi:MAG TPA: calcium-binding protein [Nostoc sp.]|uniref:beta strand repeat-containing protein n=1 Tax=Nostoc sp. TaxID=1180 RepID=UPI002D52BF4C|nr:calcium-binding protein [Nostoc sp.]HYX16526.1 calcium-binding protein [Nostoc sp.]
MANITGTKGNDTLVGSDLADTINGLAGNDTITGKEGDDTLTGGGGKDKFVYDSGSYQGIDIITDFGGVGKGTNPTAAVIAEVDILKFQNNDLFIARNLLLTQNGSNLEIAFEGGGGTVILQNFKLENLENQKATGATAAVGNILFNGQTSITDSFNVFDANSTETKLGIKNTVTFLNDLSNNITGKDDSDDVINGQGGNDKIDGKSGNDLLRGGTGNDTLIGCVGNDTLVGGAGDNALVGGGAGDNALVGGTGDDNLNVNYSQGNNLLSGGDGNDNLLASGAYSLFRDTFSPGRPIIGNNTLNGGAGDDNLSADYSTGNNTLIGDAGDDNLSADYSIGNNLLSGGAGNDSLKVGISITDPYTDPSSLVTQTVDGGIGDDSLSGNYTSATAGITSTFNATTNIGSITTPTNLVSYKNIERLNIFGTQYDDLIVGSNGNDTFFSYSGNDTIDGGKGDDLLFAVDYTYATAGITSTFNAITNTGLITDGTNRVSYKNIERLYIIGTFYDDLIVGSNGNDTLSTGSGNDTIDGSKGNDLLSVNVYNATQGITSTFNAITNTGLITDGTARVSYKNIEQLDISGTDYDDLIVGSNGNDTLSTGSGNDTIDGGKGDDLLSVNGSYNVTQGITSTFNAITNTGLITDGTKRVSYKNIERLNILGTQYDDLIVGNNGNDTLNGYSGNDTIDGGKGDDLLSVYGNSSSTKGITLTFNATSNIGSITSGTNRVSYKNIERLDISGTDYDDLIVGNNGNDTLSGFGGNDTIIGGAGNDTLIATKYSGNSILYGGEGNDSLSGNDISFDAPSGTATVTFGFNSYNEGIDSIDGFNITNQLIQVSAAGFGGGLSSGSLKATQFTIGTSATTKQERFIYNSATGGLFFDQDGSKSGFTQVQFAQLSTGLSLTENNFVVV